MIRNSVRNKIIVTFCLIVAFSLIISGGVAYRYCFNILQNQSLKDEMIKTNGTTRHMNYITDDIWKFALTIMLDNNVQNYLKLDNLNYFDLSNLKSRIKDELSELEVQRDYVLDIVLIKGKDMIFSRAQLDVYLDVDYYSERLKEPWYTDFASKNVSSFFGREYELPVKGGYTIKTIPYMVNIKEINNPKRIIGQMIINLNYEYLEKYLMADSEESDDYFWADSSNKLLFQKDSRDEYIDWDLVHSFINQTEAGKTEAYKTEYGYLIVDKTMKNGWSICSYILEERIYKETRYLVYFFLFYTAAILVFTIIIIMPIVSGITKPLSRMTKAMKLVEEGDMDVKIEAKGKDELAVLSKGFNRMLSSLKDYLSKSVEYEKDRKKIEFSLLLAQINPHFIYNTLHTVIYMANKTHNQDIVHMVKSFIAVLQDTVKINEEGLLTTFEHEIDVVKEYIMIQQYRYNGRFTVHWDIDGALTGLKVPRTILQPIVENSILHGILPLNREGVIKISAQAESEYMTVIIEDNGSGMEQAVIDSLLDSDESILLTGKMRSIGIHNVLGRIRYICGEKYGIDIRSEKDLYTRFIIKLPLDL